MKKSVKSLFLFALLLSMAGALVVSCEKGGEDDPTGRYGGTEPDIRPFLDPKKDTYYIESDGTTISRESRGYSFEVKAKAITFNSFSCTLTDRKYFVFSEDCNLTLSGGSTFTIDDEGKLNAKHLTLSGNGSITLKAANINEVNYNRKFSAAEGYTLTSSGNKDERNGTRQSCTWTIQKSK